MCLGINGNKLKYVSLFLVFFEYCDKGGMCIDG